MYGNELIHWNLYNCTLKFDCEWGNGMGPQGLGMVPWELPSGLLTPTVPWVQWYWTFTGLRGLNLNYIGLQPLKLGNFKLNCLVEENKLFALYSKG